MFSSYSRQILTALAVVALLGVLLVASPAYAAGDGPIVNNPPPSSGQQIGWAAFQGMPTIVNGKTDYWVWNDNILNGNTLTGQNVLHIRTTTNGNSHKFTGTVTTGNADNFYNLAVVNAGGTDNATPVGYNQFTFSLTTSGNGDGVDVEWSGRWLSLNLFVDGFHHPAQVLYGSSATAAKHLPLTVLAGPAGLLTLPLSTLDGTTNFQKNVADGYFIYHDASGYHLRLTTTKVGDKQDYKGTIFADHGSFGEIKMYHGDPGDYYRLSDGGKVLDSRFLTNGYIDGLDWTIASTGMTFTLKQDGHVAAPNVWLGSMSPSSPGIPAFTFRLMP